MVLGCKSMSLLNIFINIVFKSISQRTVIFLLIFSWSANPGSSQGVSDTLHPKDVQKKDSTLLLLDSPEFNKNLDQAILYQEQADNLNRQSIEMRKEAARIDDPIERGQLQKKIILVEDSVQVLRTMANEQFLILNESLPDYMKEKQGEESIHPFLVKDTVLNGITVYNYVLNEEFMASLEEIRKPLEAAPVVSVPKTEKSFEKDYTIPRGVFYRIQLAVYRNPLAADHFGELRPITTENIPERDLIRYFVGKFTRMDDARAALVKVKAMGYPDAFIVGYYDGVKASFSKLKALEN